MKIAIITSGFLPVPATKGGAVENLTENILKENEQYKKMKLTVFSIYEKNAIEESNKYKFTNFKFIKVNFLIKLLDKITFFIAKKILKKKNSHSYRYIFQRLSYLNQVSKKLKDGDYEKIILENHPTQYLALKWRKNYKKYSGKYYYHCHNEYPGTYGCLDVIKNTNRIICVSKYRLNNVKQYLNMKDENFIVLKNGINTEMFTKKITKKEKNNLKKKYNIKEDDKILLFVGRIVPEKGIKELIKALENVKYSNYKLLILGAALNELKVKTNFEKEIEKLVKESSNKAIFTGFIKYQEIYKFYAIADIAIFPSMWDDSAPLTVVEALVSGLPIITTDSGGIPEYATDGSAIIIKRDNELINNLSKKINELLVDTEKREKMSIIAKDVSKDLTLKNYYENFYNILKN